MKKILTFLFMMTLLCATSLKAQSNLSFENWTSSGNYDNPDDWQTSNLLASITGADPSCRKSGAHWGSFGMKLTPCYISIIGDTIPGFAAQVFVSHKRFQSFSFYYQYTGPNNSSAYVDVSCYKDSIQNNTPIGSGFSLLTPHSNWNYVSVDLDWTTNENPDSILITISTDFNDKKDTVIVDDIQLSEFTTSLASVLTPGKPVLFVNSQRQIVLSETVGTGPVQLVLSNALGQVVLESEVSPGAIETSSLPVGLYVYRYMKEGRTYSGRILLE